MKCKLLRLSVFASLLFIIGCALSSDVSAQTITLPTPFTVQNIYEVTSDVGKDYTYRNNAVHDTYGGLPVWKLPPNYAYLSNGSARSIFYIYGDSHYAYSTYNTFSWDTSVWSNYCRDTSAMNLQFTLHSTQNFWDRYTYHIVFGVDYKPFTCRTTVIYPGTLQVNCDNVPVVPSTSSAGAQLTVFFDSTPNGFNSTSQNLSMKKNVELTCTSSSGDVISNANQNKNDIINNQNQNKNDIINNQNQNRQEIINNENQNHEEAQEVRLGIWDSIKGIFTSILELPLKIATAILDGIKSLFIPSNDFFSNFFNNLQDFFKKKLGFLAYPFTWILDILDYYLNIEDTGSYVLSWNTISLPNFNLTLINSGSYDLATALQDSNVNSAHTVYLAFVDFLIFLGFMKLCKNKYSSIFGGEQDNYEYVTTTEGYTVDSFTGEVLTENHVTTRSEKRLKE